jgi:hypothetical protein
VGAGVRAAVEAVSRERNLRLHVEQGRAWTFSAGAITRTGNDAAGASLLPVAQADVDAAAALRIHEAAAERAARRTMWLGAVAGAIDASDDPARLRQAIGEHGRAAAAPAAAAGAPAAAPARAEQAGAEDTEVWVDEGGEDERHRTPLMRAAKLGRARLVAALIDEHGARVNVQADRSNLTALHDAAYGGHEEAVRVLLARGGDPRLLNKWGESAIATAEKRRNGRIAGLLREAAERLAAAEAGAGGGGAGSAAGTGAGGVGGR